MFNNYLIIIMLLFTFSTKASQYEQTYKLDSGDKIQIEVYDEKELSIDELVIGASGKFDYPYLGQINAKGNTLAQIKKVIHDGLNSDYLISPKIRVNIVAFRDVYIHGEVKNPGGYEYKPGLTVDRAIALAGGFTERAYRKKVKIHTKNNNQNRTVGLKSAVSPGEIIIVDQRFF